MSDAPTATAPVTPPADPANKAAFWRGAVADFAASGLSVRAFVWPTG